MNICHNTGVVVKVRFMKIAKRSVTSLGSNKYNKGTVIRTLYITTSFDCTKTEIFITHLFIPSKGSAAYNAERRDYNKEGEEKRDADHFVIVRTPWPMAERKSAFHQDNCFVRITKDERLLHAHPLRHPLCWYNELWLGPFSILRQAKRGMLIFRCRVNFFVE